MADRELLTLADLTDKQRTMLAMLAMLAAGEQIKQIHAAIKGGAPEGKSISATKNAMRSLYKQIGASNSNAAVAWYIAQLLVETTAPSERDQKTL